MTQFDKFESRHNASGAQNIDEMLSVVGVKTMDELIGQTVPDGIRMQQPLALPAAQTEAELVSHLRAMMSKNKVFKSYIGMGYYPCHVPAVIQRNILENPGWYTAYTPYQAEIAQGRLEALMNFQTVVADLTALPIANASLLDEATAAAEAMIMLYNNRPATKNNANQFFVDQNVFPQVLDVLKTRAEPIGIQLVVEAIADLDVKSETIFGIYIQNPNNEGAVNDYTDLITSAHQQGITVAMGTDLLSLVLAKPPGEMGADVAIGSAQRFGVPMGFGGPHAGFFATKDQFKRSIPGRIIGLSVDAQKNPAYRMALQTREQHIKRERATSNICTSQVLLAVMAGMYAVYHGADGLKQMAMRVHQLAQTLASALSALNVKVVHEHYFDTLHIATTHVAAIRQQAEAGQMNFRYFDHHVGIALDETTTLKDIENIVLVFSNALQKASPSVTLQQNEFSYGRQSAFLSGAVFKSYHAEHDMLRYLKRLENKDLSMAHSMISLGSCTMKLNATSEMVALSWPEVANIHPFAPTDQARGYAELHDRLSAMLLEITGFSGISFQPNSGAQGEYAGLLAIRSFHKNNGDDHRNVALIPASAHGTNPASAVMAGMKVVVVNSDVDGKIDIQDLKEKAALHGDHLSALMVTYPSTHGVFEEGIQEVCDIIHQHGGMVYMDGANMNAQVGITSPALIGADVCHLNLHKTFAIPHGGGGPGVGPICVNDRLKPFIPGHWTQGNAHNAVSAASWGSASILTISYAYIAMMGGEGLKRASELAILQANYMMECLKKHFSILYAGTKGRCAHEFIVDCRMFKAVGITVEDIAKRLIDYGFHAPTVSFPVAGTLMIEPTESEPKAELDRFVSALVAIKGEVDQIQSGSADPSVNVLKMAPHTAEVICSDQWDRPYPREQAAYPLPYVRSAKFWPAVGRIDNAHGDRNLICTCTPMEAYQSA